MGWSQRGPEGLSIPLLVSVGRSGSLSVIRALGHLHDEQHGVLGLVAEGSADDVHGVLVGDPLQGDPVHRHQLKASLEGRAGKRGEGREERGGWGREGETGWYRT